MARRKPMQQTLDTLNAGGEVHTSDASAAAPTLESVQAELAQLKTSSEELRKAYASMEAKHTALLSAPDTSTSRPQKRQTGIDMTGLPDPAVDGGDKYAQVLAERFKAAYEAERFNEGLDREAAMDTNAQMQALWGDFQTGYKDYAANTQRVRIATDEVMKIATRKRMDLNKYMFGNSDRFMKDVAQVYDGLFGKPKPIEAADDDTDDDVEDTRTMGIFGGNESGGKPVPGSAPERTAQKPGGFTQAIREFQIKHGYYR